MPNPEDRFRKAAQEATEQFERALRRFKEKQSEIDGGIRDLSAIRDAAALRTKRLASFQMKIGDNFQCPSCWTENEVKSDLQLIVGDADHPDLFRCRTCKCEIPFD